jgi:hypothetical protein
MAYGFGPSESSIDHFREEDTDLYLLPPPKGSFFEGALMRDLASGGARIVGYPHVLWHWDFFRAAWYDILRASMPNASGDIVIETSTNDNEDEFAIYSVKYKWPLELNKEAHRRMPFEIRFTRAVEIVV